MSTKAKKPPKQKKPAAYTKAERIRRLVTDSVSEAVRYYGVDAVEASK